MTLKHNLDKVFSMNAVELTNFIKARLYQNRCSYYDASEMLSECYLYCLDLVSPNKLEEDYIKLAKNYINNQTSWQASGGQPKETSKNFKLKHRLSGFDNTRIKYDVPEEYEEDNIEFAYWVEKFLDRPEKSLFKLYFVEGQSHRKIAEMIRATGIKICDTSVYLEIKKLKDKLKKYSKIWKEL